MQNEKSKIAIQSLKLENQANETILNFEL